MTDVVPAMPGTLPDGPDWTRTLRERPEWDSPKMQEVIRASAFGRAKAAFDAADESERDRLILMLIDFAIEGADTRTILTGLLQN